MATVRALLCRKLGEPTRPLTEDSPLGIRHDHPRPSISSPTGVRVRVVATSVNYANLLQVQGKYQERPPLPFIPGSDFSGFVAEIGAAVTTVKVGDPVCTVASSGSYVEELVIDEHRLFFLPPGCDIVAAAGIPIAFGTSHLGLIHRARLQAGQVLLVLGAAGGVGLAAVQIGKAYGAIVIAVARGKEKEEFLKLYGADHVIDSSDGNMIKNIQTYLRSRKLPGVDALCDPVGGKQFKDSLKCLNWAAQILVIGFSSGEIPNIPANIALVKNLTIHGLYWGSYWDHPPDILRDSMIEVLSLVSKGKLQVNISHKFPLSQVNVAFSMVAERKVLGKVLVLLDERETFKTSEGRSKL